MSGSKKNKQAKPSAFQYFAELLRPQVEAHIKRHEGEDVAETTGTISQLLPLARILLEETDRGCVLSAAAFLDDLLDELIRRKFVELSKIPTSDLDFLLDAKSAGPLASLGVRLVVAQGLGLIKPNTRRAIAAIKDLRNSHAHSWQDFSLKSADVQSIFDRLTKVDQDLAKANTVNFQNMRGAKLGTISVDKLTDERCRFAAIVVGLMMNLFLDPAPSATTQAS